MQKVIRKLHHKEWWFTGLYNQRGVRVKRGCLKAGEFVTSDDPWLLNQLETGGKRACQLRWLIPPPVAGFIPAFAHPHAKA